MIAPHVWERVADFEATRSHAQRRAGVVYTPPWLARVLARAALGPRLAGLRNAADLRALRILDPACGAGALLLATLELLAATHAALCDAAPDNDALVHRRAVLPCLLGADLDPEAADAARDVLARAAGHPTADAAGPRIDVLDGLFDDLPACDVIVANPPWGTVNRLGRHHPRQRALAARYDAIWQDKLDRAAFFVTRGATLAPRSAWLLPSALLASDKGRRFRRWLASERHVQVFDAGERMLFPGAAVSSAVLVVEQVGAGQAPRLAGWRLEPEATLAVDEVLTRFAAQPASPPQVWLEQGVTHSRALHGARWHVVDDARRARWRALDEASCATIGERYLVGKGMETGANKVFELPHDVLEALTPDEVEHYVRRRIRGVDIGRLELAAPTRWLAWLEEAGDFESLPAPLREHLLAHAETLRGRAAYRRGDCKWWRYTWPLHREAVATRWRVVLPYRADAHRCCVVGPGQGLGLTDTTNIFVDGPGEARALAAWWMSAEVVDRYQGLTKRTGAGMMEFFENQVREVPLPSSWPL